MLVEIFLCLSTATFFTFGIYITKVYLVQLAFYLLIVFWDTRKIVPLLHVFNRIYGQTSTKCSNREPGSQAHHVKTGAIRHILTNIPPFSSWNCFQMCPTKFCLSIVPGIYFCLTYIKIFVFVLYSNFSVSKNVCEFWI